MQVTVFLTLASGYFWLFNHQNTRSESVLCVASALCDSSCFRCSRWEQTCARNTTETVFEEIINAEFLVSLRTSIHFSGFALTKRALCGSDKLDRI